MALVSDAEPEIIGELVKAGADVSAMNQTGCIPLYLATLQGLKDVLKIFLQQSPDLSITDPDGNTLIHAATLSGNNNILSMVLQQFDAFSGHHIEAALPDINTANAIGESPLHFAAARNTITMAQTLLSRGADLNTKDGAFITPLIEAMSAGHEEMMKLLVARGADMSIARKFRQVHLRKDDGTPSTMMV